jgi:pimeloyl-ACP methyl ester carboxylesterase
VPPSGNSRIAVLLLTRGQHDHLAHVNVIRLLDAGWLQFRSTSFFDDRTKEVPNRLLERGAASRQKHGALTLDDLLEIAQLPDAKLDGAEMAEGARECWGLREWDVCKTVAEDIHMLCNKLGHNRIAVFAHDIGMGVGYAWAASYPDEVSKFVVAESLLTGMGEPPTASKSGEPLWHPAFHMVPDLAEQLVQGRERVYFSYFFKKFAHKPDAVPDEEVEVAVKAYSRPGRLKAGFAYYRAMAESAKQNAEFMKVKLKMPVLAVGGETCFGDLPGKQMKLVADKVTTVSLKECGHWVTSEQPAAFLKELLAFLSG